MLAFKLSTWEWLKVERWKEMRCSNPYDEYLDNEYTESDLDNFVEILFREFAEAIKVRYSIVKDILYGHNTPFFEEKARYFSEYSAICPSEDTFKSLTNKLFLPSTYGLDKQSNVQAFLDSFAELELKDKVEILDRLSTAKLELGQHKVGPTNNIGRTIDTLSEQTKYQLVKNVFEAEVQIDVELR